MPLWAAGQIDYRALRQRDGSTMMRLTVEHAVIGADEIDAQAPLYREGLGLDSIDILEIALAVSKQYGFQLRSDDSDNVKTFSSLRNLNQHVQQHRTR